MKNIIVHRFSLRTSGRDGWIWYTENANDVITIQQEHDGIIQYTLTIPLWLLFSLRTYIEELKIK